MLQNSLYPQAPLAGGDWKPAKGLPAPIINSVDKPYAPPTEGSAPALSGGHWLEMARNAYDSSESWLTINQRQTWARNFAHYRSEHAADSPVHLPENKHRPSVFIPKTRTLVRSQQAASAAAYFSSADVIAIDSEDSDNKQQSEAAALMKELVNYRLRNTIPWYLIVLGGIQEASVTGLVVSHQSWTYREETKLVGQMIDPTTGVMYDTYETITVQDEPKIRLVPIENVRISPSSDFTDPANSSPYFIELIPMFLCDVKARIAEGGDTKSGEPSWINVGDAALLSAGNRQGLDVTRKARVGQNKLDPKTQSIEADSNFQIVWIHRNIMRHNGKDWLYYTVGTTVMLSEPVLLDDVIPWAQGKRDYVIGKMEVETDKAYPDSPVGITSSLVKAINETSNSRLENIRQVLNRRILYRAGNQVDVRALMRNIPGGLIGINAPGDLSNHVKQLETQDVTSSSYQELDRLNRSMDDLTGSAFNNMLSKGSPEKATTASLMADSAGQIREMEIRTFTETFVEPVLKQLVQLEAYYETDVTALTVASRKAKLLRILPEYFDYAFSVSVSAGLGATNATQRMQRIQNAIATVVSLVPDAVAAINGPEVAKEICGIAGIDNGERFFDFAKAEQLKQQAQQETPQQQMQREQLQVQLQIAQGKQLLDQRKLEMQNLELQAKLKKLEADIDLIIAKTTTENTTAIFEAAQAAGVIAQNPAMAASTDTILKSSGFKDHDAAPVVQSAEAAPVAMPPMREGGSAIAPPLPQTGSVGKQEGIRTARIEG